MTMAAMAVPAKKGATRTVTLADGSKVVLTLHGDEHYSYYKTADGKPCQVENGRIRTLTPREVSDTWASRKQQRLRMTESATGGMRRAGKPSKTTTGTQKGLVILVEFSDVKFTTPNPQTMFQRFFNEPGFNEYGMSASVRDYFQKQSYGKLTIDFDVVGPFTTKNNMEYYGKPVKDDNGKVENHDKNAVAMVAEGVDAAYAAGVDFSKYDWDGDGEVDQVFVIYAGYAEAQGADVNTIWPHEYVLSADNKARRYNNVVIDTYGCASELKGNRGSTPDGIGTACHEFSHCLGLPDMYDTSDEGTAFGMATWDVMDQGSYNDDSCTPAGYTSYERWFSRWLEPVELNSETTIAGMKPLATTPEAYVLYNEKNRNEYYLLENRQPVDFDKGLDGHGLLILHVDYNEASWTGNTVNVHPTHQRMTIIPADNKLEYSNRQLAGDPWPGTSGNTALTNYTTPAATLYNANTDGTKLMSKPVENITEDETAMTVSFVACRAEGADHHRQAGRVGRRVAGENDRFQQVLQGNSRLHRHQQQPGHIRSDRMDGLKAIPDTQPAALRHFLVGRQPEVAELERTGIGRHHHRAGHGQGESRRQGHPEDFLRQQRRPYCRLPHTDAGVHRRRQCQAGVHVQECAQRPLLGGNQHRDADVPQLHGRL